MPNNEIRDTQNVLERGFPRLRFPAHLEDLFKVNDQTLAITNLRKNINYIFIVYVLLGLGIYFMSRKDELGIWPYAHISLGLVIAVVGACSRINALNVYHRHYTIILAALAIAETIITPYYYSERIVLQISQVGTLFTAIIVYTSLGMRFIDASIGCWSGGLLSLIYANLFSLNIDWLVFHSYFTGANILGMVLAYLSEHHRRTAFLQSRLLELEKQKSEDLAKKLERMTQQDSLTGLANRRYFDDVFDKEWRKAKRHHSNISIMFIDIDYFKKYNDHYGHQQGDQCLQAVSGIIRSQAKRAGDLAARYGGEEFVIIHTQTDTETLKQIASKTVQMVLETAIPHASSDISNFLTVSIGISCCAPTKTSDKSMLFNQADSSLYKAKENGRNQYCFFEDTTAISTHPRYQEQ